MRKVKLLVTVCIIAIFGVYGTVVPFTTGNVSAASSKSYSTVAKKAYKTKDGKTYLTVKSTVNWTVKSNKITSISGTTAKPQFSGSNAAAGMISLQGYSKYKHYTNSSKTYGYVQVAWGYSSHGVLAGVTTQDGYFYVDVKVNNKGKVISSKAGCMSTVQYKNYRWGKCY